MQSFSKLLLALSLCITTPVHTKLINLKTITKGSSARATLHNLLAEGNVILKFSASWCGPCKRMAEFIPEIAQEFDSSVTIIEIDTDAFSDLSKEYGIRSIPTLIFMQNGTQKKTHIGSLKKNELKQEIKNIFNL